MQNILATPESYLDDCVHDSSESSVRLDALGGGIHWHCSWDSFMFFLPKSGLETDGLFCFHWKWKWKKGSPTSTDCITGRLYSWHSSELNVHKIRSLPVSHPIEESAGHFLFNDNTLIPLNSIIRVIKEPCHGWCLEFERTRYPWFTSKRNGLTISVSTHVYHPLTFVPLFSFIF